MTTTDDTTALDAAARSVERLRLSESRLARRRQTDCGPSENARAAMRFVLERTDAGEDVTPTLIAEYLGVSTASVTGMLDRLHSGSMIAFAPNPADRRSKLVVPFDRGADPDDIDPLTAQIRKMVRQLSDSEAKKVSQFLAQVADAVDQECT
ncbi:MarR family transcriptional regulator [Microbacterium halimionae]|uniref:MarR family transcriptional regulator n=1 Tax=Microbacterium halimionae TaxID=1526413 RepID=UPI00142134D6